MKKSGYILIEALVAISVATLGLTSAISLISQSISFNRISANKIVANYLAAEGIEVIKNKIDSNIVSKDPFSSGIQSGNFEINYLGNIFPNADRLLMFDSNSGFYGYSGDVATPYRRRIQISYPDGNPDEIQVNSIVSWKDKGGANMEVNIEDHFFNWRPN